jgi:uncharacterized SAM-binding protein YcdF (DUF218 family)
MLIYVKIHKGYVDLMNGDGAINIHGVLRKDETRVLLVMGKGQDVDGNVSCFTKAVVETAVQLDRKNPDMYAMVIFPAKGHPTLEYKETEARTMMEYAVSLGMNPAKAVLEEEARDTIGTFHYVDKMLSRMDNVSSVTVVACDYHMPRVEYVANKYLKGRYGLQFVSANTHLSTGNESHLLMADEEIRLNREKKDYGMIKDGDNIAMAKRVEAIHGIYSKGKVKR